MANHHPYWFWDKMLNPKQIKTLNKLIMSKYAFKEPKEHQAFNEDGTSKKNVDSYVIFYKEIKSYIRPLLDYVFDTNRKEYGYDIWDYDDKDTCLYNIYTTDKKSNYDWHIDEEISPYSDIKFTMIINLSEKPFEGGDLFLQKTGDIEVKELKSTGSMIIFKSHTRHMVTPITKGERRNLVLFLTGPNFK